ncbi:hypothetical protein niasHT_003313 [Heterodera trifolii]|uniref:BTB domain-containing protein n=1 Tax=Heterodera trifolii TaxID=157864 RepID=A0ABD2LXV9_9BILA
MPSSMDRMKHLLSTSKHSDVHFLVGDGDEKEILPSHQLILKNASDVFEAMFLFDAKKKQGENAAFKVMLSFIYADDLSGLNGDNAIVLYTAKKYNIPDLADRSLQIPISKLRNVFMAYAQALIFELEKMLCNLLDRDRLLLSNEFEIWNAALRWADEKCRQNGIERSSGNRRSFLGPALFKIRFPNIHEEQFSICVVPSGLLTMEEVLGIYQFNSHPNLFFRGVPGLYSLKFPSHGRIFNWNIAKGNRRGTLSLEIEKVSEFAREINWSERKSEAVYINGIAWEIVAQINPKIMRHSKPIGRRIYNEKWLGIYLLCVGPKKRQTLELQMFTNLSNFVPKERRGGL